MSVPTLGHTAVNAMFLPNRKGILKRDNNVRAKVRKRGRAAAYRSHRREFVQPPSSPKHDSVKTTTAVVLDQAHVCTISEVATRV